MTHVTKEVERFATDGAGRNQFERAIGLALQDYQDAASGTAVERITDQNKRVRWTTVPQVNKSVGKRTRWVIGSPGLYGHV